MDIKLAKTLSTILHPVILPLIFGILILKMPIYPFSLINPKAFIIFIIALFILTYLLPIIIIYLMYKFSVINSFELKDKKERILPLLAYSIILYLTTIIFKQWNLPMIWNLSLLLMTLIVILTLFISTYFKISIHLAGWGGLVGLIIFLTYEYNVNYIAYLSIALFLSSIIAWARAKTGMHNNIEIISGFFLGLTTITLGLFFI